MGWDPPNPGGGTCVMLKCMGARLIGYHMHPDSFGVSMQLRRKVFVPQDVWFRQCFQLFSRRGGEGDYQGGLVRALGRYAHVQSPHERGECPAVSGCQHWSIFESRRVVWCGSRLAARFWRTFIEGLVLPGRAGNGRVFASVVTLLDARWKGG